MSDETDVPKVNGKPVPESDREREDKRGPVQPANEVLFEFLDELFAEEGEFPERIDVYLAKGRNRTDVAAVVKQYFFKQGSSKPSKERLVAICNEIVRKTKTYASMLRRECDFMVAALNNQRSSDHYDSLPLIVKPSSKYKNGNPLDGRDGMPDLSSISDDDEQPMHERWNLMQIDGQRQMMGLMFGMVEGLLDRSDRQAQLYMKDSMDMRTRYVELVDAFVAIRQADKKLDHEIKKAERFDKVIDRATDVAVNAMPALLTAFRGGNTAGWTPGTDTEEARTIRSYFRTADEGGQLSPEQFQTIFGRLDNGRVTAAGILSLQQSKLLADIAACQVNPDSLDLLLEGGALEIHQEQFQQLVESGISLDVFMPLKLLFDVRNARRQKMSQSTPQ